MRHARTMDRCIKSVTVHFRKWHHRMISEDSEALVCLSGLDEIKEKLEDTLKQAAKPGQFVSSEAALESDEKTEAASLTENESQNQMQISSSDWK